MATGRRGRTGYAISALPRSPRQLLPIRHQLPLEQARSDVGRELAPVDHTDEPTVVGEYDEWLAALEDAMQEAGGNRLTERFQGVGAQVAAEPRGQRLWRHPFLQVALSLAIGRVRDRLGEALHGLRGEVSLAPARGALQGEGGDPRVQLGKLRERVGESKARRLGGGEPEEPATFADEDELLDCRELGRDRSEKEESRRPPGLARADVHLEQACRRGLADRVDDRDRDVRDRGGLHGRGQRRL